MGWKKGRVMALVRRHSHPVLLLLLLLLLLRVAAASTWAVGSGRTPEWDAWFHGPCFEQHAHQSCALRAPSKSADTIEKLPAFLHEQLPDWMYVYTAARADARCIRFPEAQLCKYDGVDEVFDVVRKLARCDVPPRLHGVSTTD